MWPVHYSDVFSLGTLLVALGLYRKMSVLVYQHNLMWTDFAARKGLNNGKTPKVEP